MRTAIQDRPGYPPAGQAGKTFRPATHFQQRSNAARWQRQHSYNVIQCVSSAPRQHQCTQLARAPQKSAVAALPAQLNSVLECEINQTAAVLQQLRIGGTWDAKCEHLLKDRRVQSVLYANRELADILTSQEGGMASCERCMLLTLPAIGQGHVLASAQPGPDMQLKLANLAASLLRVDNFYDSLGGLAGYQLTCLQLCAAALEPCPPSASSPSPTTPLSSHSSPLPSPASQPSEVKLHMPLGVDLAHDVVAARRAAANGLTALPYMAEIYPLGGAGDRLGLKCEVSGDCLPTAMLQYCGRTLLEGLVRDLQAREYLHYQLTGEQHTTPVALMTSEAKGNDGHVRSLLKELNWFGRSEQSFRLFRQPMVPVVGAEDGRWLLPGHLAPAMKPGGHGAIWKLMLDQGIFDWLAHHGREAAVVRQISNPLAGTDTTLLALSGSGYMGGKLFGFASCERAVGAAEGMNVLAERRVPSPRSQGGKDGYSYEYAVTNIEYTEFKRLGIEDEAQAGGSRLSVFPANTNVLYVNLKAAEGAVRAGVAAGGGAALPGMIFNGKKVVEVTDAVTGKLQRVRAGRLECTMQNLVDSLVQRFPEPVPVARHSELHTFVVFNKRRRVTSSAKRSRAPGSMVLAQTPDGSFRDLMNNARELLLDHCGFSAVPEVGEVEQYLERGPGFIFLFHPALGPLWDVIAQKLRGGCLEAGAELVLQVAEADVQNLQLDGSLLVNADAAMGLLEAPVRRGRPGGYPGRSGVQSLLHLLERGADSIDSMEGLVHNLTSPSQPDYLSFDDDAAARGDFERRTAQGASLKPRLVYSAACGRVRLHNVTVRNAGIDWEAPGNVYWRHRVTRRESCRVTLNGHAEFEARDVVLNGDISYQVPDGFRMLVTSAADGRPQCRLEPLLNRMPSWQWKYSVCRDGLISLTFEERESRHSIAGSVAAEKSLAVRDYRWGGQGGISVRSLPSTLKASGRPVRLERTSRANHPFGQLRQTEAADWSWLSSQL